MTAKIATRRQGMLMITAIIGLVGCAGDPGDTALTPDLLEDQQALSSISNRLEPAERAEFNRYVLNRTVGSRIIPGEVALMPNGKDPATVAEAISLMRAIGRRDEEVKKLSVQRDSKLKEIGASLDKTPPSNVSAYNVLVDQYNATIETFGKQIEEVKAKPLILNE